MIDEIFSTQEARNKRAKQLKAQGYRVKRYSHRNQCLHPMYLEDLKNTPSGRDTGFGNTVYKTFFSAIYGVKTY